MKKIYFSSGSKGGTGKSFFCMGLLDYLTSDKLNENGEVLFEGENVLLIETDTDNPDVGKQYASHPKVKVESVLLDDASGWIRLVNLANDCEDTVVVNSAARCTKAVAEYGETLLCSLEEIQREITTFWVINRQRDSLELLKKYMNHMTGNIHVVRNLVWGPPDKFELFEKSEIKKFVEERGGVVLDLPEIADRVADDLYCLRLYVEEALKTLPVGNRAELRRWRKLAWKMFSSVLDR